MKVHSILLSLFLCSCAYGVDTSSDVPEENAGVYVPAKRDASPPKEDDSQTTDSRNCFTYSYWVNNCLVSKVYCDDQLVDVDVKCTLGRPLFPWEYIPDPPPPWLKSNKGE